MSKISYEGRVVIVTGAGGGLGREYALEIARRGGAVVVNDNGADCRGIGSGSEMADGVAAEITSAGGKAVANHEDVGHRDAAQRIADSALSQYGRIDALINNAGNLRNDWFENVSIEDRDSMMSAHLKGNFNVAQAVWPHMKRAKYGRIVFVASAVGAFGNEMQSAYGVAKGGIIGLMNVLAQEGRPHNITCNALLPNAETRMVASMDFAEMAPIIPHTQKMGVSVSPPFVAPMAVYLASELCTTTHELYSVMGGRMARAFVGVTEGWLGPRDAPPSVEDVAAHIEQIRDVREFHIPSSLKDEFRIVAEQIVAEQIVRTGS